MSRSAEIPTLYTNFAVRRTRNPEASYDVKLFPRLGALRRSARELDEGTPRKVNIKVARPEMKKTLSLFEEGAAKTGLELGRHDPAVQLLRVTGVGFGPSRKDPQMHPGEGLVKIDDGKGNIVQFRLVNQPDFVDGEGRKWDGRVVALIEKAKINGEEVPLTYEMGHNGFVFLSKGMPDILQEVKSEQQPTATIRQETPDAICFVDGHHTFAGNHDLGCYCKEERAESLRVIHERGGINSLMPGTGNGNGSEAQDIQTAARYSRAQHNEPIPAYQEIYPRMGMKGDDRNNTLKISTLLLEHLFQVKNIPNITTLTESRVKQNIWHEFGAAHTVTGESLNVTPMDHPDSRYKQDALGYTRADKVPFPLQPR